MVCLSPLRLFHSVIFVGLQNMSVSTLLGSCATLQEGIAHVDLATEEAALLRELQDSMLLLN